MANDGLPMKAIVDKTLSAHFQWQLVFYLPALTSLSIWFMAFSAANQSSYGRSLTPCDLSFRTILSRRPFQKVRNQRVSPNHLTKVGLVA